MIAQIDTRNHTARHFDIRKLTPRECGRLMAVPENYLDLMLAEDSGISNSAAYKLFGNAIVVQVLMHIMEEALYPTGRRLPSELSDMFTLPQFRMERDWAKEPFKLISLCAGIDTQAMSLDMLQRRHPDFRWVLTAWSEFDPESSRPIDQQPAVVAHRLLFPDAGPNLGDMTKIDWTRFMHDHAVAEGDIDLLTYSTPCFVAGTLVMTADGLKPIEQVTEGDRVLTHTNSYRRVVTTMERRYEGDIVTVKPMFCHEIRSTDNHPYYVRTRYRHGHKQQRGFRDPEWKEARLLTKDDYLGYAVNTKSRLPDWQGTVLRYGGRDTFGSSRLRSVLDKEDFWYLMGRYLGDGWLRDDKSHKAMLICSSDKSEDIWMPIQRALQSLGWRYTLTRERTALRYTVYGKELVEFCRRYGNGAAGKRVDADTIALPTHLLRYFIKGYRDSDGSYNRRDRSLHFTSVSYELLLGMGQCIAKVFHRPFSITRCAMPRTTVIEGRTVNQRDFYVMRFKETDDPQDKAFYEGGYLWMPINHISHEQTATTVYNMEVDADHSYTAYGAIVHNCQSISQAGKREGIARGSGTRSSVLWSTEDAVAALRPKILLQENVRALVNRQNIGHFREWCSVLERQGYANFLPPQWTTPEGEKTVACVLNSRNYGVPQNRDRVYMVSIRKDIIGHTDSATGAYVADAQYEFPRPFALTRSIADVLEEDVSPKFFLKPESVEAFLKKNERQGDSYIYRTTDRKLTQTQVDAIISKMVWEK